MAQPRIGHEFKTVTILIKRYLDNTEIFRHAGQLTGTHGHIIGYISHNSDHDIYACELEKAFNIRRSTVSQILALMEKNNLILRESVGGDARKKRIVLTEHGHALHSEIEKTIDETESFITRGMTEKEKDTLVLLINKIINNLGDIDKKI